MVKKMFTLTLGIFLFAELTVSSHAEKWAIVIGISEYNDSGIPQLQYAHEDANLIKKRLIAAGLQKDKIKLITNERARRADIEQVFEDIQLEIAENDSLFIYFSGHGSQGPDDGNDEQDGSDEFILPYDALATSQSTWIRDDEFHEQLTELLKCETIVIAFDSCHSGGAVKGVKTVGAVTKSLSDDFLKDITEGGTFVIAACQANQKARESDEYKQGLFTHHLLRVFGGKSSPKITDRQLFNKGVVKAVEKDSKDNQTPTLIDNVQNNLAPLCPFLSPLWSQLLRVNIELSEVSPNQIQKYLITDPAYRLLAARCLALLKDNQQVIKDSKIPLDVIMGKYREELGFSQKDYVGPNQIKKLDPNLDKLKVAIFNTWKERHTTCPESSFEEIIEDMPN